MKIKLHWNRKGQGACNRHIRYCLAERIQDITCPECLRILHYEQVAYNYNSLGIGVK